MALTNFIPTVWSETLYQALDREYVAVQNCNREFEGDIRRCGDTVNICGIGAINVFAYTKDSDISNLQTLSSTQTKLTINQVNAFNFQIDDVDSAQQNPKVMQHAMRQAASALADCADKHVFGLCTQVDKENYIMATVTEENILDTLIDARKRLMLANVGATTEVVLEVTPEVAAVILKAKIATSSSDEALENGYIGNVVGFRVYVSNNVVRDSSNGNTISNCFVRTKRAIAYAEQLNEVEAYRPEKRFADAIKGLHLFGAKIVYPAELFVLQLTTAN
jgi:hypothetical protein